MNQTVKHNADFIAVSNGNKWLPQKFRLKLNTWECFKWTACITMCWCMVSLTNALSEMNSKRCDFDFDSKMLL